jgi:hypothetical protein
MLYILKGSPHSLSGTENKNKGERANIKGCFTLQLFLLYLHLKRENKIFYNLWLVACSY